MVKVNCGACQLTIHKHLKVICCGTCKTYFHVKCCDSNYKDFQACELWECTKCRPKSTDKRKKCGHCSKKIPLHMTIIQCALCDTFFHGSCSIPLIEFQKTIGWTCDPCMRAGNPLPFSTIDDDNLLMTLTANDTAFEYIQLHPSFTVQSLLNRIPGDKSDTSEDFLTESISSKYYTPSEFIKSNPSKTGFSIMHLNIASLQCHIDDLRTLLNILGHSFDIIGISETRLNKDTDPIIDISIDGYDFVETRTKAIYGGTGLYIKNGINYILKK